MYVKKLPELDYGVSVTMKALGGKWKACLLECIHLGICRPSEMRRNIAGSTLRVLVQQLKEMEELDIVCKKIYPEVPLRVEYYLTEWGTSLIPVIAMMNKWGNDYSGHHYIDCNMGAVVK
jgi:DNA-binding HxlR family transcriptional regulator